jgi:hypothetical protein
MPAFFGVLVTVIIGVVTVVLFGVWGFPFTLVIGALILGYIFTARKRDGSVATVERGGRPEPTGVPRKSPGGVETANQRQGQEV